MLIPTGTQFQRMCIYIVQSMTHIKIPSRVQQCLINPCFILINNIQCEMLVFGALKPLVTMKLVTMAMMIMEFKWIEEYVGDMVHLEQWRCQTKQLIWKLFYWQNKTTNRRHIPVAWIKSTLSFHTYFHSTKANHVNNW